MRMLRHFIILILFSALLYLLGLSRFTAAQHFSNKDNWANVNVSTAPSAIPSQQRIRGLQSLINKAQNDGVVRVNVGLSTPFKAEGELASSIAVQMERQAIARTQDIILQKMRGANFTSVSKFEFIPYMTLEVDAGALLKLASLPEVNTIQEDQRRSLFLSSSTDVVGAPQAWAGGYTGRGQTIVILDTGVDKNHPFFQSTGSNKVVSEACYSTNSTVANATSVCPGGVSESTAVDSGVDCTAIVGDEYPDAQEDCHHGTHIAGIAAGNDGTHFGIARDASIISMQIFSLFTDTTQCNGETRCIGSLISDEVKGLQRVYELRHRFKIAAVNLSFGKEVVFSSHCDGFSFMEKAAIDKLRATDIVTIASSGNNGYTGSLSMPACISTVVSVGATTDNDKVASFSNIASFIDLLAPGVGINSSVPGGGTASMSGTSQATPHVAGVWALMRQRFPSASVNEISSILENTGASVDDTRVDGTVTNMRRINVKFLLPVFVDVNATGFEDGTLANPFNTVIEGVNAVPNYGIVKIFPGHYPETLTIERGIMELQSAGATVTIGETP